ncbi:MAG: hypothetical protein K6E91_03435 [Butyrivibrio sp.]|nr:hypothetical protein [Butyrivibrio sp.]
MKVLRNGKSLLKSVLAATLGAAMITIGMSPITASAATTETGAQRPTNADFNWINGISDIYAIPGSGRALTSLQEITGEWKGFLGGIPSETNSFFGSLNAKIEDKGSNHATMTVDWYTETSVDNKTGRPSYNDTSKNADTTYTGGYSNKMFYAEDTTLSHQFISGDAIKNFIIVNFYQQGNTQYALGAFQGDGRKTLGNIFMTRTVSGSSLLTSKPVPNVQAAWAGYVGYFETKSQDEKGRSIRDSIYIEPISADHAYVVIDVGGKKRAVVGKMQLENGALNIYAASGALFDSIRLINNNTVSLSSRGTSFTRGDTSSRAPEYWNHLGNRFAAANEWND